MSCKNESCHVRMSHATSRTNESYIPWHILRVIKRLLFEILRHVRMSHVTCESCHMSHATWVMSHVSYIPWHIFGVIKRLLLFILCHVRMSHVMYESCHISHATCVMYTVAYFPCHQAASPLLIVSSTNESRHVWVMSHESCHVCHIYRGLFSMSSSGSSSSWTLTPDNISNAWCARCINTICDMTRVSRMNQSCHT